MSVTPRPAVADCSPTAFIDSDHDRVGAFVARVIDGAHDDRTRAQRLFAAVRDEIRYDPYSLATDPTEYRASTVLARGSAYCVPKAVLLTAAARAAGIPARLGFADVRNHLQSERLAAAMTTDLFVYHGFSVLWIDGTWLKASPAFNTDLCVRFGVAPLDFDGRGHALLHAFTGDGRRHMEYVRDRGTRQDLPLGEILATYAEHYPGVAATLAKGHDAAKAFSERLGAIPRR
ncbi:transglutaminase-like domain-containing protein [Conexibacter sp. DBS9H8]|uniref:transglutaminase-like domain-containing protein n=1 Tax=Conexibacter sp. DBS9H8 TaxID=2937801 RepID=UPI00200F60D3|nr:transglutaminase domain-containing protein [Conexibacter sp. DBS9H8]